MDVLTPEQRRRNMQAIKCKNTKIESILAKAMWTRGLRYRRNDKTVKGKPDFVFKSIKVAGFCDSEFFHGRNWEIEKKRIKTNQEFWIAKIEGNIARDNIVNKELVADGWCVLRFWGNDIKKHTDNCVDTIYAVVQKRKEKDINQPNATV